MSNSFGFGGTNASLIIGQVHLIMRPAARVSRRAVALFGLFVSTIVGAWFALDRLIVSAEADRIGDRPHSCRPG